MRRLTAEQARRLGEAIQAARGDQGMRQEDLAVAADLSQSALSAIERGRTRNLRPTTIAGIRRALGWTADEFEAHLAAPEPEPEVFLLPGAGELTPEERAKVVDYARWVISQR